MRPSSSKIELGGLYVNTSLLLREAQTHMYGSDLPKRAAAERGITFDLKVVPPPSFRPVGSNGCWVNSEQLCFLTKGELQKSISSFIQTVLDMKLETMLSEFHAKEFHAYIKSHSDRVNEISVLKSCNTLQIADELGTIVVRLVSNVRKVADYILKIKT
jgi:hypothetical protein